MRFFRACTDLHHALGAWPLPAVTFHYYVWDTVIRKDISVGILNHVALRCRRRLDGTCSFGVFCRDGGGGEFSGESISRCIVVLVKFWFSQYLDSEIKLLILEICSYWNSCNGVSFYNYSGFFKCTQLDSPCLFTMPFVYSKVI